MGRAKKAQRAQTKKLIGFVQPDGVRSNRGEALDEKDSGKPSPADLVRNVCLRFWDSQSREFLREVAVAHVLAL